MCRNVWWWVNGWKLHAWADWWRDEWHSRSMQVVKYQPIIKCQQRNGLSQPVRGECVASVWGSFVLVNLLSPGWMSSLRKCQRLFCSTSSSVAFSSLVFVCWFVRLLCFYIFHANHIPSQEKKKKFTPLIKNSLSFWNEVLLALLSLNEQRYLLYFSKKPLGNYQNVAVVPNYRCKSVLSLLKHFMFSYCCRCWNYLD